MPLLATAFSILAAAAGLYYLLDSGATTRLGSYDCHVLNRRRIRLRRVGGAAMLVLGICFFAGSSSAAADRLPPRAFMALWFVVLLMLLLIVILAAVDVNLTYRMYKDHQERQDP
jgi:hypothetical protein